MSTKHYCDGCDREIKRVTDIKRVRVAEVNDYADQESVNNPKNFDLCGSCFQEFHQNHLPPSWARQP